MSQVTAVRTPLTASSVASSLASAWPSTIGGTPTEDALTTLTTQIDVETGWTNCWNYNVGNIAGTGGDYVMLHASDGTYRPYRAFTSLVDGVTAYLNLLKNRYSTALSAAQAGDLDGFASNLKTQGYYQEPESQYLAALQSRFSSVAAAIGSTATIPISVIAQSNPWSSALVALAGGLALGGAAFYVTERAREFRPRRRGYA
jgi:hypothetical protein